MRRRALLSVSDKTGLVEFARALQRLEFDLYSTGGTLKALHGAGINASSVAELTRFPEIMDGRVKTLHPGVHAAILARRAEPRHMEALAQHSIGLIDLVCVNLYPFAAAAADETASFDDVIEQVDIGGPAMVRAAAKNHADVLVVVHPGRYDQVVSALSTGDPPGELRRELATEAFAHTAAYDAQIAAWFRRHAGGEDFPQELAIAGSLMQHLRYGENPHQRAAFYASGSTRTGVAGARQLQGLELSYNNIQDAAAALALVAEFKRPAAAIIKHTNPCGLAVADELEGAYRKAYDCDPVSAFGGVVAFNRELDAATAELLSKIFLEVVVAPSVTSEAARVLASKAKLRLLEALHPAGGGHDHDFRSIAGGFLVQTRDAAGFDRTVCRPVTRRAPTEAEWGQLEVAWLTSKHVKSNAIVLAHEDAAVGIGAGQMSRVEAVRLAVERAGSRASGSVMGSDAFFPFPDGIREAAAAGVTAVIQPGGSVKDGEVIAAADEVGMAMVLTGERHFRH